MWPSEAKKTVNQGGARRSPDNKQNIALPPVARSWCKLRPWQTHFGRWRSGDGWFDGQRCRGAVKRCRGQWARMPPVESRVCQWRRRRKHSRVADVAGRASACVMLLCATCTSGTVARCGCLRWVTCLARVVAVVMAQVVFGCHNRISISPCGRAMRVAGLHRVRTGGHQRWQNPSGHGGAREAPKDQHHHQHEKEAATHAVMIRLRPRRFPGAFQWTVRGGADAHTAMYRPGRWFMASTRFNATAPAMDQATRTGSTVHRASSTMQQSTAICTFPARQP